MERDSGTVQLSYPGDRRGFSTLFFRNRHLLVLSIVVILLAGLTSILSLPRLEDPRLVNRNPLIITRLAGATAERVDALVTEKIEAALDEIDSIKTIDATSSPGISLIAIELLDSIGEDENTEIFSEIRDRLGDVAADLPPEASPPFLDDKRGATAYTLILAVRAPTGSDHQGPTTEISRNVLTRLAEELADRLRTMPGTELVRLYGEAAEQYSVLVERSAAAELGLSAQSVAARIAAADAKGAAGVARGDLSSVPLEVRGELTTADRIARIPLLSSSDVRGGGIEQQQTIRVGDVASVIRTEQEPVREIALIEGIPCVFVAARMSPLEQTDVWTSRAYERFNEFQAEVGPGITFDVVFEQDAYTTARLGELAINLLAGAVVVAAVIGLMMGLRQAFIVGLALPLVISLVMFALGLRGNSLHQMSIFGMIIALGLLIDNAIVVADEVGSRLSQGMRRIDAVRQAVQHLAKPLLASTLTTVCAFSPILLLPGNPGDFVGSIGESVVLAITFSFAVALTITAALAGLLVHRGSSKTIETSGIARRAHEWARHGIRSRRLSQGTQLILRQAYLMPVAAIAVAATPALLGFVLARTLGNEFFPPVDRNMFEVRLWTAPGTSIERTQQAVGEADRVLRSFEDVTSTTWLIGASYPPVYYNLVENQDNAPEFAQGMVTSRSEDATKSLIPELQRALDDALPGTQVLVRPFGQGPPIFADIEFRLAGPDRESMQTAGEILRQRLQLEPEVLHTQMSLSRGAPKIWVGSDEDLAELSGLTLSEVADQLRSSLDGTPASTVLEDLKEIPVRVRLVDSTRETLDEIASLQLVGSEDVTFPLNTLGMLTIEPATNTIKRYNGQRTNIVQAWTIPGTLPIDVTNRVLAAIEQGDVQLPPGTSVAPGGAAEADAEAVDSLATYAPILVTLSAAALILSFRSVVLALVLVGVAGLSVGIGLLATWTIQFPISFNTILGVLGLIGVAINDSIVVLASIVERAKMYAASVDRRASDADSNHQSPLPVSEIADAVMGCMRHVLSTTLTTIGGFLPLLIFVGGDFWPSLAIVLGGGISGATLLSVLFVPACYRLIDFGRWQIRRRRSQRAIG